MEQRSKIIQFPFSSLACPCCFEKDLLLDEDSIKKNGLASRISIMCSCGYVKEKYTSKTTVDDSNSSNAMKPFEVNTRMVYALYTCDMGHAGLETFTCIMNMHKPMTVLLRLLLIC